MRGVSDVLSYWRHLSGSKMLIGALFALALTISGGALLYQQKNTAEAASCTKNDIIRCGVNGPQDFKRKVNRNARGDLNAIYNRYGVNANEVANRAVEGTAYMNGTIKVNGRVVATNAHSLGRSNFSYSNPQRIGGKTYYESSHKDVLNSNVKVLVVMDKQKKFKYAVIKACANPVKAKPTPPPKKPQPKPQPKQKQPVFECTNLDAVRLDEDDEDFEHTYQFEVTYQAKNGATLQSTQFDFGNGETQTVTEVSDVIASQEVTYTSGEYDIAATLVFDVNGQTKTVADEACTANIVVPQPPEEQPEEQPKEQPEEEEVVSEIPETGPAQFLGGALGAGSIAGAGYYFRASRRNLLDSVFSRKK